MMKRLKAKHPISKDDWTIDIPPPNFYEEIARLILVIVFSLLAIGLFIDYLITKDALLLAVDTIPGSALAAIVPHYFKKYQRTGRGLTPLPVLWYPCFIKRD